MRIGRIAALLNCGLFVWSMTVAAAEPPQRPSVLLIVTDDQRPDSIAELGNSHLRTPTLDGLVRRGTTFTRAVCAYPICVASRAELLTGCTAFRALQPYPNGKLNDALPTLPAVLQRAGYRTVYVGKWHTTGRPSDRGYEESRGLFSAGAGSAPLTIPLDRFGKPNSGYRGWVFQSDDGEKFSERGVGLTPNISESFADAAIEAIHDADPRPFFLHVNFTAPHDPRFTPRGYERNGRELPPVPTNFAAEHPFDHGNTGGRDEVLLPRPLQAEEIRRELATYYALIEHLDAQCDRILAAAAERRRADDIIVVFTSDHGLALGSHGLTGKQNQYEHTIGVPLIVAGPGIPQDKRSAADVYLRDLFPTLCELCGTAIPAGLDGKSLAEVLSGRTSAVHPFVVGYFTDTQRMIRRGDWKLIRYPKVGREQLFDLEHDPHELHNLSGDAGRQPLLGELRSQLAAWLAEHGDPLAK